MIDSLTTAAHGAGYLHGLIAGGALGGLVGVFLGLVIAALLHAAAGEPPPPESKVIPLPNFFVAGEQLDLDTVSRPSDREAFPHLMHIQPERPWSRPETAPPTTPNVPR